MARYYWLKLHDNFFDKYEIKKLRKIPGGDTYTIIYLKLLLYTMNTDGKIPFEGLETHIHKEIALKINEDETSVEMTLNALKMMKLLEEREGDVAFPEHEKVTGAIAPKPSRKSLPENIKNKYGKFENVKLSDKEIEDLKEFFGSEAIMWQKVPFVNVWPRLYLSYIKINRFIVVLIRINDPNCTIFAYLKPNNSCSVC